MTVSSRFHRTRHTHLIYISQAAFGWYLYAIGPSIDLLRLEQNTSLFIMSLHFSAASLGSVIGGVLTSWTANRFGRGRTLQISGYGMSAAIAVVVAGNSPAMTIAGMALIGLFSTGTVTLNSSYLDQAHGQNASVALAEANLAAAFMGLLSPLFVGITVAAGWGWRIGVIAAAITFVLVEVFRGDHRVFDSAPSEHHDSNAKLPSLYWWTWALLITTAGAEFMVVLWNTALLRDRAGLGDAAAAAGLATFTSGIALGRFIVSRIANKIDNEKLLRITFWIPLVAFWGLWAVTNPVVMLVSLFVFGIGAGAHWPLGIGRLVKAGRVNPDLAVSRSAFATGSAGIVLPLLLGSMAEAVGVHMAFLMVPVVLAAGIALLTFAPRPE